MLLTSPAEPFEIFRNWRNSPSLLLQKPSEMLFIIESPAPVIWFLKVKSLHLAKSAYIRLTNALAFFQRSRSSKFFIVPIIARVNLIISNLQNPWIARLHNCTIARLHDFPSPFTALFRSSRWISQTIIIKNLQNSKSFLIIAPDFTKRNFITPWTSR